eukprot:jgi/Psemu1/14203/gm1.14203_g
MKFINVLFSLLLAPIAISAEDTTSSSPQLRGLGSKDIIKHYNGFTLTLSHLLSQGNGCAQQPAETGDYCNTYQQQCLHNVLEAENAEVVPGTFWTCNCDTSINQYGCGLVCLGSKCIDTHAPTAAPKGGRGGELQHPPTYTWCPKNRPDHQSDCEFVGMECPYLGRDPDDSRAIVLNCECDIVSPANTPANVWFKKWVCTEKTD